MKVGTVVLALLLIIALIIGVVVRMEMEDVSADSTDVASVALMTPVDVPEGLEVATFGTGCFWCMEAAFQETPGITSAISGYAGGTVEDPTYEQVYTMQTDHREAVQVLFDPKLITFEEVLDVFWRGIDPTDAGGQFVDRGFSYTTAVFYHSDKQRMLSEASIDELAASDRFQGSDIVTPVVEFTTFYEAEEYHQDFYIKSPDRYDRYENASGRDEFREFVWSEIQSGAE